MCFGRTTWLSELWLVRPKVYKRVLHANCQESNRGKLLIQEWMIETCTETNAYARIVTTMIKNTRLQVGLGFLGGFGPFGPVKTRVQSPGLGWGD